LSGLLIEGASAAPHQSAATVDIRCFRFIPPRRSAPPAADL